MKDIFTCVHISKCNIPGTQIAASHGMPYFFLNEHSLGNKGHHGRSFAICLGINKPLEVNTPAFFFITFTSCVCSVPEYCVHEFPCTKKSPENLFTPNSLLMMINLAESQADAGRRFEKFIGFESRPGDGVPSDCHATTYRTSSGCTRKKATPTESYGKTFGPPQPCCICLSDYEVFANIFGGTVPSCQSFSCSFSLQWRDLTQAWLLLLQLKPRFSNRSLDSC